MEHDFNSAVTTFVAVKTENIDDDNDNKHCLEFLDGVECKVEPLEILDYGVDESPSCSSVLGGSGLGESATPYSYHVCTDTELSHSDDFDEEGDLQGGQTCGTGKRKRWPSDSESSEDSDSSSDDDVVEQKPDVWVTDCESMRQFTFEGKSKILTPELGQKVHGRKIDWFDLLLNEGLLGRIAEETNKRAEKLLSKPSNSRILGWTTVTPSELRVFIGLLYHMGTVRLTRWRDYWTTEEMFDFDFSRWRMTRTRFLHIMRCLAFSAEGDGDYGEMKKLVELFNETMESVYYPGKDLVMDEEVELWKRRKVFSSEYKKKCDFKLYSISEPTGTVLKYSIVLKKDGTQACLRKAIKELMAGKCSGHSVLINTEFGVSLAKELLGMETYSNAFLKADDRDIPAEVKAAQISRCHATARYADGVMVGKWNRRQSHLFYMSTEFKNTMSGDFKKDKMIYEAKVPLPVLKIRDMGKVPEVTDPLSDFHPVFQQRSLSWSKKFFIHLLQVVMFNAFKLYNFANAQSGQRECKEIQEFRIDVVRELLGTMCDSPGRPPVGTAGRQQSCSCVPDKRGLPRHVLTKLPTSEKTKRTIRRRCRQCSDEGVDRHTQFWCEQCPTKPALCHRKCFLKFHNYDVV